MEPDKNLQEALLRSHQATDKYSQGQSQLKKLASQPGNNASQDQTQPELHEKPSYLLKSWDTLRQLDQALVNRKPINGAP